MTPCTRVTDLVAVAPRVTRALACLPAWSLCSGRAHPEQSSPSTQSCPHSTPTGLPSHTLLLHLHPQLLQPVHKGPKFWVLQISLQAGGWVGGQACAALGQPCGSGGSALTQLLAQRASKPTQSVLVLRLLPRDWGRACRAWLCPRTWMAVRSCSSVGGLPRSNSCPSTDVCSRCVCCSCCCWRVCCCSSCCCTAPAGCTTACTWAHASACSVAAHSHPACVASNLKASVAGSWVPPSTDTMTTWVVLALPCSAHSARKENLPGTRGADRTCCDPLRVHVSSGAGLHGLAPPPRHSTASTAAPSPYSHTPLLLVFKVANPAAGCSGKGAHSAAEPAQSCCLAAMCTGCMTKPPWLSILHVASTIED